MKVNFVDLGQQYHAVKNKVIPKIYDAIENGAFMGAASFEKKFAEYHDKMYCVGVGSGTDALWLSLVAAGIGPGDEVIVPANTYIATALAVSHTGARPVFVDPDAFTYVIDVNDPELQNALSPKTRAIIPVHLYGYPVNMNDVMNFAEKHSLLVIEDCAQSAGGVSAGRYTGAWGDAGCFDGRTKVLTYDGYRTISSIKIGDRVLTHKNNFKVVSEIYERYYEGSWVKLKLNGMRSTAAWRKRYINATEEHPILVNRFGKETWVPIREVNVGDWVYIRSGKCSICGKKIPFFWDLCEYHNPDLKQNANKAKHSYIESEEFDLVAVEVESAERSYRKKQRVYNLEVEDDHSYFVADVAVHNCFSFYPTKNLGGLGQGGAIITDNAEIAIRVRELGNVGRASESWFDYIHKGYNSRLDHINAIFLEECLDHLDNWNIARRSIATVYDEFLFDLKEYVSTPPYTSTIEIFDTYTASVPVYHLYELKCYDRETRDKLKVHLEAYGIGCGLHYPVPCHRQSVYSAEFRSCPVSDELSDTLISLPMHPNLDIQQLDYVYRAIKKFFK